MRNGLMGTFDASRRKPAASKACAGRCRWSGLDDGGRDCSSRDVPCKQYQFAFRLACGGGRLQILRRDLKIIAAFEKYSPFPENPAAAAALSSLTGFAPGTYV